MSPLDRVRRTLRGAAGYQIPTPKVRVKLDANESPYPPPEPLRRAIADEAARLDWNRYPDPTASDLKRAIADDLGQPVERLVIGNGSDELIGLLCSTFAEPLDGERAARLVYPGPSFVVYRHAAAAAAMEVVEAPLGPRFEPDAGALEQAIDRARPSLVFVATPNNPTGTTWDGADLARLAAGMTSGLFVVDEAYAEYGGTNHLPLVEQHRHVASLRTYSKIGLAGLRIGVLVAQPEVAREVEKVRPPYNLGLLQQRAATIAIRDFRRELSAHVGEVVAERARLSTALAALPGLEAFPSGANLIMVRTPEATRLFRALLDRSILVRCFDRPGQAGPLSGCLRVTVGTPAENDLLLGALEEILRP